MALSEAVIGLHASYPAQPLQVAAIRRAVSSVARRAGAQTSTLIRLELAVSEAATNVVLHAYRGPGESGRIFVTVCIDDDGLEVFVRDNGSGMAPRADSPGMGLGLSLMAGQSDRCEIRSADGGGTEVLMRFELPRRSRRPGATAAAAARAAV